LQGYIALTEAKTVRDTIRSKIFGVRALDPLPRTGLLLVRCEVVGEAEEDCAVAGDGEFLVVGDGADVFGGPDVAGFWGTLDASFF
jgi:hypothetical protein